MKTSKITCFGKTVKIWFNRKTRLWCGWVEDCDGHPLTEANHGPCRDTVLVLTSVDLAELCKTEQAA